MSAQAWESWFERYEKLVERRLAEAKKMTEKRVPQPQVRERAA